MEEYLALQKSIVYGPILSRRLGRSLGINILSPYQKICSFDCCYCQYGPTKMHTLKPPKEALQSIQEILREVEKALVVHKHLETLTFSGNGEPTLHPDFGTIVKEIRSLRNHFTPEVKLALFTNSTNLEQDEVRQGIRNIEIPIFKLDVGDNPMLEKINKPTTGIEIDTIIDDLASMDHPIIQSLFIVGGMEKTEKPHFQKWMQALKKMQPKCIQLYSCDESLPAKGVEKIPRYRLSKIAEIVQARIHYPVEVY